MHAQVAKCQTCVKAGDTLLSLAQDYKTDWLQLWGANVNVGNPNKLVPPSGNVFEVQNTEREGERD